ncbi:hypothetical protein SAMN05443287_11048 [Micromonospora phaseoli]|uniref:Uncharacterized protein n=1 Tax=Micromonospora phaseoli TaxID=1144548 RepID=A0A1H7CQ74_9ACTN|nr:hypothetical protein [Micromonospora phaseoli]PZV91643.1 hypothetical protein CLV64_111162 [Micromonospora phaseoli]GIJ79274.1 hypothetical protein Xph01_37060 [Micromonospora phaseoli]SEJ91364.1 hypothetical protein SAMN05443287_11048 [Micromonospora phaseoli]
MTTKAPSRSTATGPDRLRLFTAGWLGLWAILALLATITGAGYPLGANDQGGGGTNLLRLVPVEIAPPLFAVLLLAAAVAALTMRDPTIETAVRWRVPLLGFGWAVAFVLAVVVPDARVLIMLGYAPILLFGAPFGWPDVDYAQVFTWALAVKVAAMIGGLLLGRLVLRWQRRTADACAACGRAATEAGWASPASAARWGRMAAYLAAAVPAGYALTRFAWAAGVPFGISTEMLADMQRTGLVWGGAALGAFALVGAVLTLGLVQRWGERFPRWMVGLAGRPVPVRLAVVPAGLVALAVTAASLGFLSNPQFWALTGELSMTTAPMLFFPLWGLALGAATYAYHLRRRGVCGHCGRG